MPKERLSLISLPAAIVVTVVVLVVALVFRNSLICHALVITVPVLLDTMRRFPHERGLDIEGVREPNRRLLVGVCCLAAWAAIGLFWLIGGPQQILDGIVASPFDVGMAIINKFYAHAQCMMRWLTRVEIWTAFILTCAGAYAVLVLRRVRSQTIVRARAAVLVHGLIWSGLSFVALVVGTELVARFPRGRFSHVVIALAVFLAFRALNVVHDARIRPTASVLGVPLALATFLGVWFFRWADGGYDTDAGRFSHALGVAMGMSFGISLMALITCAALVFRKVTSQSNTGDVNEGSA